MVVSQLSYSRWLRNWEKLPFIGVKDGHAKDGDRPADQCDYDDTNNNGHASSTHGREELAADDTCDCSVANHDDHVQETSDFRRPVTHEVPSADL